MHPAFAGSKKKQRRAAVVARKTAETNADLATLYAYARLIQTEDELDLFLLSQPDEATRAAIKQLMEPMVLFTYASARRVVLATELDGIDLAATPEKATQVTLT